MTMPVIKFEDFEYSIKTRKCVSKRAALYTEDTSEYMLSNAVLTRYASKLPPHIPFSDLESFYSYFTEIGLDELKSLDLAIMTTLNDYCAVIDVRVGRGLAGRSFEKTVPNIKSFNYKKKTRGPAKCMMYSGSRPGEVITADYHILAIQNRHAIGVYVSPRVKLYSHDRLMPMNKHSHVIVIPRENVIWS